MSFEKKCRFCILPSMIGTVIFYLFPYLRVVAYSIVDNPFRRQFVGLDNYIRVWKNPYFQLALKNSLLLLVFGVPLVVLLSVFVSLGLSACGRKTQKLKIAFLLPMVVPTAGVVALWRTLFGGWDSVIPVYLLFLWKNIGICVLLETAALSVIDREVYEAAKMDGACGFRLYRKVVLPMIAPTLSFTMLLTTVNSFRIFKESYLYYGSSYPPDHSYTLQYYMNNHFLKLNYQNLASGGVVTSLFILLIVALFQRLQRRYDY